MEKHHFNLQRTLVPTRFALHILHVCAHGSKKPVLTAHGVVKYENGDADEVRRLLAEWLNASASNTRHGRWHERMREHGTHS
jgi:hypothetical protein